MRLLVTALILGAIASVDYAGAQERLRLAWARGASDATSWVVQVT
jgi:hypothetical protein